MPNWITNRLILNGESKETINEMLGFLEGEVEGENEGVKTGIDFNNIIPMPEELKTTKASLMADNTYSETVSLMIGGMRIPATLYGNI